MNLANKLTLFRIFLVIIMVVVAYVPIEGTILNIGIDMWILNIIFIIASITDKLDGNIARKRNQITEFGKFLDPIADKMLVLSAINKLINDFINENEIIDIIKEKNIENKITFLNKKYNETRMLLLKNEQYLKNIYEDKVNHIITTEQFILLSKDYNNNNIAYNEQLNIINKEINKYKNNKLDYLIKKQIDKYRSLESLNRIVIDEFINKICIGKKENAKKRTIKIIWNI